MLPDYAAPAPKPKAPAPAPAPKPARSAEPAPRATVAEARSGANDLYRVLSFGPPKFDPTAVPSARAQLEAALASPKSAERARAEAGERMAAAGYGFGGASEVSDSQRDAGERRAAAGMGPGLSTDGKATGETVDVDDARAQLEKVLRDRREVALGADKLDFTGNRDKAKPMTAEQYEALDPRQRQAVDFNTMLVRAVRRDRNHQDDYTHSSEEQRAKYESTVKSIFGEDGGSEQYSPETVALLKRIGFDDSSADLDDFLSLKAGIHARDIKQMDGPAPTLEDAMRPNPEAQVNSPEVDRSNLSDLLAAKTGQLQDQLAKGTQLLQSMNATATADRNGLVAGLGGVASPVAPSSGFGGSERDRYFQAAFDTMSRSGEDVKRALAVLNQNHPEDYQDFLAYAATRVSNAQRYGIPLGGEDGVKYRTPEQIRKELGLDEED